MTQADRVHSTPPLNTPIDTTRRRFLTVAAGASIASVGTLAVAAMPAASQASAACVIDPIFAIIEEHKALSIAFTAAIECPDYAQMVVAEPELEEFVNAAGKVYAAVPRGY